MKRANQRDIQRLVASIRSRLNDLPLRNTSEIRSLRRLISRELSGASAEVVFDLAEALIDHGFEFRFIAYELVANHAAARRQLNAAKIQRLGRGIDSWAAVDTFAIYLAGPAWQVKQVGDAVIRRWSRSRDRWWRRAALVATVPLNSKTHGGAGDAMRTLAICHALLTDRDDMVVKAMSWALRELAKRDQKAVAVFLREQHQLLAPRVLREVNNKINTGLKNPRRNSIVGRLKKS
jgi:3-methyladenine DNA glycosylase AlkD